MKAVYLLLFIYIDFFPIVAQDIINPYKDFNLKNYLTGFQYPPVTGYQALNPNNFLYTPAARQTIQSYNGEYMIILNEHPWSHPGSAFWQLAKTFKIEVVSFPFTVPCWDQPIACGFPLYGLLDKRILMMPDDPYDQGTNKWGNLNREFVGNFLGVTQWVSDPGKEIPIY